MFSPGFKSNSAGESSFAARRRTAIRARGAMLGLALLGVTPEAWAGPDPAVTGVVRDVAGAGISNLTVRATVWTSVNFTELVAMTDVTGRFGFLGAEGSWSVIVDGPALNALGYLDVRPASFSLSNEIRGLRFTTRRLELNRRIEGVLTDDTGTSLPWISLLASIVENDQIFETNVVTGSDGAFDVAVSPAIWQVSPFGFAGTLGTHLFPETDIVIEPSSRGAQVVLVAPRVTGGISGVASNLSGFEIVAETMAYGRRYVQATRLWDRGAATFSLPLFNGVWTVAVTNRGWGFRGVTQPPPPMVVAVTNSIVELQLSGTPWLTQPLAVRVLAPDGRPMPGASVYASSENGMFRTPPPTPGAPGPGPLTDPTTTTLQLTDGRWTVVATATDPAGQSWQVRKGIVFPGDGISNLDLVIPQSGIGPRITGLTRDTDGVPRPGRQVTLRASEGGTNFHAWLTTGVDGRFAVNVLPGRWQLTMPSFDFVSCSASAVIDVTSADQAVELVACPFPPGAVVPVSVTTVDETAPSPSTYQLSLSSGSGFYSSSVVPNQPVLASLRTGVWTASLSPDWFLFAPDSYELMPTLKFQPSGGGSTDLVLVARLGSARIEGRLRDPEGRLLTTGYASARANIGGTNYAVNGQLNSGYFSLNVIPGEWEVAASTWRYPALPAVAVGATPARAPGDLAPWPRYSDPPPRFVRVSDEPVVCDFMTEALPHPVPLTVAVVREDGTSVGGVAVLVSDQPNTPWGEVDTGGRAFFAALPGRVLISGFWSWQAGGQEELVFPAISVELLAASNYVVLVARAPTTCLRGTVRDDGGRPLPLPVTGNLRIGNTNYTSTACPDAQHEFCLPVLPGTWDLTLPEVNSLGYGSASVRSVAVPAASDPPRTDFVLQPFSGDFRQARWVTPIRTSDGIQLELRAEATLVWRLQRSDDWREWISWNTVVTSNGVARITDPEPRPSRYYRARWEQ